MFTVVINNAIRNSGTLATVELYASKYDDGTETIYTTILFPSQNLTEEDVEAIVTEHKTEIVAKTISSSSQFSSRDYEKCGIIVRTVGSVAIGEPADVMQIVLFYTDFVE